METDGVSIFSLNSCQVSLILATSQHKCVSFSQSVHFLSGKTPSSKCIGKILAFQSPFSNAILQIAQKTFGGTTYLFNCLDWWSYYNTLGTIVGIFLDHTRRKTQFSRLDSNLGVCAAYLWGTCCARSWWNSAREGRSYLHSGPASQEEWCCSPRRSDTWQSLPQRFDLHGDKAARYDQYQWVWTVYVRVAEILRQRRWTVNMFCSTEKSKSKDQLSICLELSLERDHCFVVKLFILV